jgi:proteasome lid subunit RPN8/RPN11
MFRSRAVVGIAAETLSFVLDAAADTHPNEYMGLLRGERASALGVDADGLVATDVLVIPGTESNSVSATVRTSMVPNDRKTVGSVHSHPNGVLRPSDADRAAFGRGRLHLILGHPYGPGDWRAFDREGEPRDCEVFDVELPDPADFFDFDEADLDL